MLTGMVGPCKHSCTGRQAGFFCACPNAMQRERQHTDFIVKK